MHSKAVELHLGNRFSYTCKHADYIPQRCGLKFDLYHALCESG